MLQFVSSIQRVFFWSEANRQKKDYTLSLLDNTMLRKEPLPAKIP